MGKKFSIRASERHCVLWLFSSSIPGVPRFNAVPSKGDELTGKVEVIRGRGTETSPLKSENIFDKGFGDINYKIYVMPDQDCEIELQTLHFRAEILFIILTLIVVLAGIAPALVA